MKKPVKLCVIICFAFFILLMPELISADTYTDANGNIYTYSINNPVYGGASITDFQGKGDVVVPDELGGSEVICISTRAFENCNNLTSVEMPDSVRTIFPYAFKDCGQLENVILSDNLTMMGTSVFNNCYSLKKITIPGGITKLGESTFLNCQNLTEVTLGEGITTIATQAFYNCSSLTNITLPFSLTSIGGAAFYHCISIEKIDYMGSATDWEKITIENGNDDIKSVSVHFVADDCSHNFNDWEMVSEATCLKSGYHRRKCNICGYYAGEDIAALGHDIDNVIWQIKYNPNCYKTGLEELICERCFAKVESRVIPATNEHIYDFYVIDPSCMERGYTYYYCIQDGCSASYEADYTETTQHAMGDWNVYYEPTCTGYGYKERWCNNCGHVEQARVEPLGHDTINAEWTIENYPGCTTYGTEALMCNSCGYAVETRPIPPKGHDYMPETVYPTCTESGYTRHYCVECFDEYKDSFTEPTGHTYTEWEIVQVQTCTSDGVRMRFCFPCGETENETIPAFGHDTENAYWEIIDCSVESNICSMALKCPLCGCNLEYKTMSIIAGGTCGDNITWILEEGGILRIIGTGKMNSWSNEVPAPWYSYRKSIKTIIIGDKIENIGENAFSDFENLTKLEMGEDIKVIGELAFWGCTNLDGVQLGNSLLEIGTGAFMFCNYIYDITIPESVISIGDYAFYSCSHLSSITVDENNKHYSSVNGHLFNKDKTIIIRYSPNNPATSYVIPDSVSTIGECAFDDCTNLREITIPESVTSIGNYAFVYCDNILEIVLPDSIISIGDGAFKYCSGLSNIIIPDSVTYLGEEVFESCDNLTSVKIGKGIKTISPYMFQRCGNLSDVDIGENVTEIGRYAFYHCAELIEIVIPDSVVRIGESAFDLCGSLETVKLGKGVMYIDDNAFKYCFELKNVIICSNLKSIGSEAFHCCENMVSIILPRSVTEIKRDAFESCDSLKAVYYLGTETDWQGISIAKQNEILRDTVVFVPSKCTITEVSNDGNTFIVNVFYVDAGKTVILALFDGDSLVEMQNKIYQGVEVVFTTNKQYTNARIMVLDNLSNLKPLLQNSVIYK